MSARGKRICHLELIVSHEELSEDKIISLQRPDDTLLIIYGCPWNVKI